VAALLGLAVSNVAARADEAITHVNNQESLSGGVAPLHVSEMALNTGSAPFVDTATGTRFLFGYEAARSRTIVGVADLYTDLDLSVGVATLQYAGNANDPSAGASQQFNQAATYVEEEMRLRLGKSFDFLRGGSVALTPFVGVSQKAWGRDNTAQGSGTFYDHVGMEVGGLVQLSLPLQWVLGADAAIGRTVGTIIFDGSGNPIGAKATSFSLRLDHRTFPDWHQRLEIRQSTLRYDQPNIPGNFEPQRTSGLAILFSVGGEISVL
jgi:hypothetical protein